MKKILVALLVAMLALIATVALAAPCEGPCTWNELNRVPATCTEAGHITYACTVCQSEKTEVINTPQGDGEHNWENAAYTEPTCISKGYWKNVCSDCGAIQDGELAATGVHTYVVDKKVATCTEAGYYHEECKYCGWVVAHTDWAALGHNGADATWIKKEGKDTCTTDQTDYYQCARANCFKYYTVVTNNVKDHKLNNWAVDQAPTCLKAGVEIRSCQNTGCKYFETRAIKALGHNIVADTVKTNDKGVVIGYCLNCKSWVPTDEKPVETPEVKPEQKPEQKPSKPATKPSTPNKPTTNKDGVTIPATGETMNVAPFIMMLVAIVGLAVTKQKVTE